MSGACTFFSPSILCAEGRYLYFLAASVAIKRR